MKRSRAIVALLAVLIGSTVAVATPAVAASSHLCEAFHAKGKPAYCVGAPALATFKPVVETTAGRDLHLISVATKPVQVKIEFNKRPNNTSLCVAANNSGTRAVVKRCNGQSGTVWYEKKSNGHLLFKSREFAADGLYLCGRDDGRQFLLEPLSLGFFCRFNL